MKTLKNFAAAVVAGAGLLAASQAGAVAVSFTNIGDSAEVNFVCTTCLNPGSVTGLDATVTMTLTGYTTTGQAVFAVTITNNSDLESDRLYSLGFESVSPDLLGAAASDGWFATLNTNFPNSPGDEAGNAVDLCVSASKNCPGGPAGVDGAGGTASFTLTLDFDGTAPFTFTNWFVKFQGEPGSFQIPGDGGDGGEVPEPGILALLGLGLLGLGLRRRKVA